MYLGNRKCLINAIVAIVIVIAFLRVSQRKETEESFFFFF